MRDKETYPTTDIVATFDSPLFFDKYGHGQSTIAVRYGNNGELTDNLLHDGTGKRIYPTNEQRAVCQSYLIDAERNIQSAFDKTHSAIKNANAEAVKQINADYQENMKRMFQAMADNLGAITSQLKKEAQSSQTLPKTKTASKKAKETQPS